MWLPDVGNQEWGEKTGNGEGEIRNSQPWNCGGNGKGLVGMQRGNREFPALELSGKRERIGGNGDGKTGNSQSWDYVGNRRRSAGMERGNSGSPTPGIAAETGKDWREWGGENWEFPALESWDKWERIVGNREGKPGIKARIRPGIVPALEFPFPAAAGSEGMAEAGI